MYFRATRIALARRAAAVGTPDAVRAIRSSDVVTGAVPDAGAGAVLDVVAGRTAAGVARTAPSATVPEAMTAVPRAATRPRRETAASVGRSRPATADRRVADP